MGSKGFLLYLSLQVFWGCNDEARSIDPHNREAEVARTLKFLHKDLFLDTGTLGPTRWTWEQGWSKEKRM